MNNPSRAFHSWSNANYFVVEWAREKWVEVKTVAAATVAFEQTLAVMMRIEVVSCCAQLEIPGEDSVNDSESPWQLG